jgi:hypothetical protein
LAVTLAVTFTFNCEKAAAQNVTAMEIGGVTIKPKAATLPAIQNPGAKGDITTTFKFHPQQISTTNLTKDIKLGRIDPANPITRVYTMPELHGTRGSVTYNNSFNIIGDGKTQIFFATLAEPEITPGVNKDDPTAKVSIESTSKDPFTFSSTNPEANFEFAPQGFDNSFSLLKGTAFPSMFAPSLGSPGAIVDETSMVFMGRIAPGVISDPDAFWSGVAGNVDLFSLTLTSDLNHDVTPVLSFGRSTSQFTLDYKNQAGIDFNPFDPSDPTVNSIKTAIASAFNKEGALDTDLTNLFTVGFVPISTSEFTLGSQADLTLTAAEVPIPEPATWLLLGSFLAGLAGAARRYRSCDLRVAGDLGQGCT